VVRWMGVAIVAVVALSPLTTRAEECGALPCRANGAPYVTDKNTTLIYPGENFSFDIDPASGKIGEVKPAPKDRIEENQIVVAFAPLRDGMILIIGNAVAGPVKYDAVMRGLDGRVGHVRSRPA